MFSNYQADLFYFYVLYKKFRNFDDPEPVPLNTFLQLAYRDPK